MQCLNTEDMRVTHIQLNIFFLLRLLNEMRTQNPKYFVFASSLVLVLRHFSWKI